MKTTKNRQQRVSTFPASLVADLRNRARDVEQAAGPDRPLFPGCNGAFANRRTFQRIWTRAARRADWPMRTSTSAVWHPMTFAMLRRAGCSSTLDSTRPLVSALLGHADTGFTLSRYVGVRGDLTSTVTTATDAW